MFLDITKIMLPATLTFLVGIAITPWITNFLYKNKMWKKTAGKVDTAGNVATITNKFHKEADTKTPRMGGIVIWASVVIVLAVIWLLAVLTPLEIFDKLDFLSRDQTWIPLAVLVLGALVGLIDDLFEIRGTKDGKTGGLSSKKRLAIVGIIAALVASWFFFKLDIVSIAIPFFGLLNIGWLIIPLFVVVMIAIYSGGVIDGLDGLSGGVFATMFSAYTIIAYSLDQINLAAFSAALVGAILAFLWFNIPPARFYMTETGSMALTMVLAVLALMTDSLGEGIGLFVLPIIALPLLVSAASSTIQILSKKYRGGKKVLLAAPLHYHFEAKGWPAYKVVMRYWIISVFLALIGVLFSIIGRW
jgi:phospho-N-acetylmuramoyl-pentapeptide-transferase